MNMDDIAKLAKVSKSAVSLALNGKPGVSEDTRKRIIKIAQENEYYTNTSLSFKENKPSNSRLIRFVACTNTGIVSKQYESLSFFMDLINNIDLAISKIGYSLIISSIDTQNITQDLLRLEQEQKSAGVLLLGTNLTPKQIQLVAESQDNLVVLDTCFETLNVNFVVMNNALGAYQAGKHLINLGHRQIGYVKSNASMYNFTMRQKGFFQAINEHDLKIKNKHSFSISPTLVTSQESFKQEILKCGDSLPTALFCECDYMAISVIKSLTELGIKVPEAISVIGFDNIFESQIISPELTTIHVETDKIAAIAVDELIKSIDGNQKTKMKVFVDTELVVRNSSVVQENEEDKVNVIK